MTSNLKWPLPLKHYELELIEKISWVGKLAIKTSDNGFVVSN
ncbi:hypothetical protein [Alteromonas mediterranea]|nr:hypothetical protein [Alteromonas mediterranea]